MARLFHRFVSNPYNILLIFLFLLFIFRPGDKGLVYEDIWKLLWIVVLLAAIFTCRHHRGIRIFAFILAIPMAIFSLTTLFNHRELFCVLHSILTIIFMITCTVSIIINIVVIKSKVTMETMKGVVSAYLMVAFTFAHGYYLTEFLNPGSILISDQTVSVYSYFQYLSKMFYFSFVTLLAIGYGDIVSVSDVAQSLAVMEGVIGQFYMAILVAKLVSAYNRQPTKL